MPASTADKPDEPRATATRAVAAGRLPILFPLFADVQSIKGIGPRLAKHYEKLGVLTIADLLFHRPERIIDRSYRPMIGEAEAGRIATMRVKVDKHMPGGGRQPYKVRVSDATGFLTLVFFQGDGAYLKHLLPERQARWVSGPIDEFQGERQIVHPDFVLADDEFAQMPTVEPVYPATAGLSPRMIAKAVRVALERMPDLPEWQDPAWIAQHGWADFAHAVRGVHAPSQAADLDLNAPAIQRLAYDELLASQLALGLVRARLHGTRGRALVSDGRIQAKLMSALPFKFTQAQERAIAEIAKDLASPRRMVRLLQGDVGSGKTIVALFAMAAAAETGAQSALMAPTEILARQHAETIEPLARAAGLRIAVLTGRDKGRPRERILEDARSDAIDILIGTHAVIEEEVEFRDLALVVIDEQHRFGVHQRVALTAKGNQPTDLLVMSATPIPRTLTLALYGDMDVTRLDGKPPGRQPIKTVLVAQDRIEEVIARLKAALAKSARAYWVCPLVAESEATDLAAAEERAALLSARFPGKVGLVHGRLKAAEKTRVMSDFQSGAIQLLVATTVIEVGVDVPEATIIIIEQAERFGLAQLHQLRGRVGRGKEASSCVLLYRPPLGEAADARLKILRDTEDGFRIAEEDLRLRGAGDVLGARQSGLPDFRIAQLEVHGELQSARGRALRILLYLFGRDEAVRLLRSG